ncbi:hypothetical protein [Halocola ammonii]
MNSIKFFTLRVSVFAFAAALIVSCAEPSSEEKSSTEKPEKSEQESDSLSSTRSVVKYQGEIFSIPSPVQSVMLLKKADIRYNEDLLNDVSNSSEYIREYKKALNLGVYGTDLAYLANFENNQLSLKYLTTIESLSSDLNIQSAVSQDILERFTNNIGNRDSLYALNGEFYRAGYRYLKQNERNKLASLILTGGWIEALHLSLDAAQNSELLRNRVGQQRSALNSIVKLTQSVEEEELIEMNKKLTELQSIFEELEYTYEYQKPITDQKEKTTYINSKSSVTVTDEQLKRIKEKTNEIREIIIS